jgi:hypothetical protein
VIDVTNYDRRDLSRDARLLTPREAVRIWHRTPEQLRYKLILDIAARAR